MGVDSRQAKMRQLTSIILISVWCFSLAKVAVLNFPLANVPCGFSCKKQGGECMKKWQGQDGYLGICRRGRWPDICYCGYCYKKTCTWTAWFDRDDPGTTGDHEVFGPGIPFPQFLGCEYQSIEIRVVGTSATYTTEAEVLAGTGEIVQIRNNGFVCLMKDQPDGECLDYEVRFCCP